MDDLRLLTVFAHPDDETFRPGGTVALLARQGVRVEVLTFGADGLSGHPDHIAIGLAAAEACRRAEEVVALYTVAVPRSLAESLGMRQIRAVPDENIARSVGVSAVWDVRMSAMRCCRGPQVSGSGIGSPLQRAGADT